MTTRVSKEHAAADVTRLVEARDGLDEFVAEHAEPSPLVSNEPRRSRANRVREPLLLRTDGPAGGHSDDPILPASRAAPVAKPELTLGIGLDAGWSVPTIPGRSRLAGGVAVVALVLSVAAAGIVMLRKSPPRSLANLSAPATDAPRPDAFPPAVSAPPPAPRVPQLDRAVTTGQRTPLVSIEPALAGPATARPGVPPVSLTAIRTQPAAPAGQRPVAPGAVDASAPMGAPGAPVVAWLRPGTDLRTPPSARVEDSAVRPAASATPPSLAPAAPAAPPGPPASTAAPAAAASTAAAAAAPTDVSPRGSVTAAPPAALPEAPPRATPPPATPPPATASSSRAPELARAASPEAPVAVVTGPSRLEVDTRAIEAVLGRYRNAFNRLDASSASAVWPSVDEKSLAKAFERIENQNVSFDNCDIQIGGVDAQVNCRGTARYVPKVGSRTPRDEARRWKFNLRRTAGGWTIDKVEAR